MTAVEMANMLRSLADDGETVIVKTRRGQITINAVITDNVQPKTIFIPFHFSRAPANILTGWAVDALSGTPELKVSASKIIKVK